MSWTLRKKAQALLADEQGTVRKDWGGKVAIALVYPNTYAVGMSNLGFQTIYRHLNAIPDVVCERVFLPDPGEVDELGRTGTSPFSLESQRPLADFHMVGFSVTYEGDYINVLRILDLAGIPLRAADRRPHDPLVLMGGVCAFSNPEPIAPFMDFVVVGEGEELVVGLMAGHRGVDAFETIATVKTPSAEYGHMALLEVGKGCGRGCRFCLEGQVYRPVRHRSLDALRATVAELARQGETRVGLVGACVSNYPGIAELLRVVAAHGLELSISSLRADSLTADLAQALARGGRRPLTRAPRAGTERLRRAIRKGITD